MNQSIKAALLSAFLFPGVGHYFLKKYIHGTFYFGTALGALYIVISWTVERALHLTDKIQHGEIRLDSLSITEFVSKQTTGGEAQLVNIASAILLITWVMGTVDSYRVGRILDKGVEAGD